MKEESRDDSSLLSLDDVSNFLVVAKKTIRNWVSQKRIPYFKINGSIRFGRKQLEHWIERGYVDSKKD